MKIGILLLMLTFRAYSPGNHVLSVLRQEPIQPHEAIWKATCRVESNFNPYAVGDKHLKKHSYGVVQIRQSRLDDFYRETGIKYDVQDMFDPQKSKHVFMYYANFDNEVTSRTWNGGPNGMQKKSTLKYWDKIKLYL
ncbi:MAG: transglycosylase SLT domain-containing protein [Deltaproteobacteria bacterium]|nr:transglycosylase SLT domain-containing protein [Deltaproteobacteria bacterium]